MMDQKAYWDQIYKSQTTFESSWIQEVPHTSLQFIHSFNLPKYAKIIDIGGGDSFLVDYLLEEGFIDITVLDISEAALNKAKLRLGEKSTCVKWIVSDITQFNTTEVYDLWHDRATFHFLITPDQIETYLTLAAKKTLHYLILGTFSSNGPEKCSGLPIQQYDEKQMENSFKKDFTKIRCIHSQHRTPKQTDQDFLFCSFEKKTV